MTFVSDCKLKYLTQIVVRIYVRLVFVSIRLAASLMQAWPAQVSVERVKRFVSGKSSLRCGQAAA